MQLSLLNLDFLPFLFFLLHLLVFFHQSDCFVTQLPACGRYHGNFSVRHDDKYYEGKAGKVVRNVTRRECGLYCTLYLGCFFLNHRKDGAVCELMMSLKRKMTLRAGWQVVQTDYSSGRLRGPLCRYIGNEVCGGSLEPSHCEDTCEAPGFKCANDVNIAVNRPTTASSSAGVNTPDRAVNGGKHNMWISQAEAQPWLMVDLEERRYVSAFFWISILALYDKDRSRMRKMKKLMIKIGDSSKALENPMCFDEVDHINVREQTHYCTKGPMWGRYVVLTRTPGPVEPLYVAEVKIYALDMV